MEGKLQREGEVIHMIVRQCYDLTKLLRQLTPSQEENLPLLTLSRADEKTIPASESKKAPARDVAGKEIFPKGRNFK